MKNNPKRPAEKGMFFSRNICLWSSYYEVSPTVVSTPYICLVNLKENDL